MVMFHLLLLTLIAVGVAVRLVFGKDKGRESRFGIRGLEAADGCWVSTGRWSPGRVPREVGLGHDPIRLDGSLDAGDVRHSLASDARRTSAEGVAAGGHGKAGRDRCRHPELVAVHVEPPPSDLRAPVVPGPWCAV